MRKKQGCWQIIKDEPLVKIVYFVPSDNLLSKREINQLRFSYIDQKNRVVEIGLEDVICQIQLLIMEQDKLLNIKREYHPFVCALLDEDLVSPDFKLLYQRILNICEFDLQPENKEQSAWMRYFQFYWGIFAIRLTNLIIPTMPDPVAPNAVLSDVLLKNSTRNVIINSNFEFAFYQLLKAGKSRIIQWAEKEGIDYPFNSEGDDITDLFIHILQGRLKQNWEETIFAVPSINLSKKKRKEMLVKGNKFLSDGYVGQLIEKKYEKALRKMGWEGYVTLALRKTKHEKLFNDLWKKVIKCNRQFQEIIDNSTIYWENGLPYQTRKNRTRYPIHSRIDHGAYINWYWSKFPD